jgi:hypothetical protein
MTREIPLYCKGQIVGYTLVDDEDFDWLSQWRWGLLCNGRYAGRGVSVGGKNKTILMHRIIAQTPDGMETDHIDRNKLNNCRSNLRHSTISANRQNRIIEKPRGMYTGVSWDKHRQKWRAEIKVNRKKQYIGHFTSEESAARAYNIKALELYGPGARINNIQEPTP